jgi:trans-aconitate methyltransferase
MIQNDDLWHVGVKYDKLAELIQKRNAVLLASLRPLGDTPCHVFEFGCGTGYLTSEILRHGSVTSITAIDRSSKMIEVAQKKPFLSKANFQCCSFFDFEPSITYDVVFANAAFHWLYPEYEAAFRKIADILKVGGTAYLSTAGRNAESEKFDKLIEEQLFSLFAGQHCSRFSARRLSSTDLETLAKPAGLQLEDSFLVERWLTVSTQTYVEWLIASKAILDIELNVVNLITSLLQSRLASVQDHISVGHWSLFVKLRREE